MSAEEPKRSLPPGSGIGIGVALGVALGVAMDNIAIGIAIGIALGAGLDVANSRRGEVNTADPEVRRRMKVLIITLVAGALVLLSLLAVLLLFRG